MNRSREMQYYYLFSLALATTASPVGGACGSSGCVTVRRFTEVSAFFSRFA